MKKVIICGLGAVGMTYAYKLKDKCELRILADKERVARYIKNPPVFNQEILSFEYILPDEQNFKPDLIIVATKAQGLDSAIRILENFVSENTIIISLLNGISSERKLSEKYPNAKVLKSYFIGHSAVRNGHSVTQDGVGEIVVENNQELIEFFQKVGINYSVPKDINYSMWLKFTMNIFSNQTSAVLKMSFGELKHNKTFIDFAKKIIAEVKQIASETGVQNLENLQKDALLALASMCDEGKTSMHQDILAGRKTEVDIFAGEIIRLGKEYGISTPCNQVLYDLIKIEEERNEHCIHSC